LGRVNREKLRSGETKKAMSRRLLNGGGTGRKEVYRDDPTEVSECCPISARRGKAENLAYWRRQKESGVGKPQGEAEGRQPVRRKLTDFCAKFERKRSDSSYQKGIGQGPHIMVPGGNRFLSEHFQKKERTYAKAGELEKHHR